MEIYGKYDKFAKNFELLLLKIQSTCYHMFRGLKMFCNIQFRDISSLICTNPEALRLAIKLCPYTFKRSFAKLFQAVK